MGVKIGLEHELNIIDADGRIVNMADKIIAHRLNYGYIIKEIASFIRSL